MAFRCNPRQEDNCPETHYCCSDDPAADMGSKPDYVTKNVGEPKGAPYFSGNNNAVGTSGMCVRVDDIAGQGLMEGPALNCPIPCNPTWDDAWINDVCGTARVCCQTVALDPEDCVNDGGGFRPVTGDDIGVLSAWKPADHVTHQDPNGSGCLGLANNDNTSTTFQDCVRQLSVADQRGFCMALAPGQPCPTDPVAGFVDACTALNGGGAPPA